MERDGMDMSESDYKKRVKEKLAALTPLFAKVCLGDYSATIDVPENEEDEFSELYVGVQMMLDIIEKQVATLQESNQSLEKKIQEKTAELNRQLDLSKTFLKAQSDLGEGLVLIDEQTHRFLYVNNALCKMSDYTAVELFDLPNLFSVVDPKEHAFFIEQLNLHKENANAAASFETRLIRKNGSPVHVDVVVKRLEVDGGVKYLAVFRDITERKRTDEKIRLLDTITSALSETEDFHSALAVIIRKVCLATGWVYGEAWAPAEEGNCLMRSRAWYQERTGLERFNEASLMQTYMPGIGLPGRVWESRRPVWIEDIATDGNFQQQVVLAEELGLKTAVGIPVLGNGEVLAVLVFTMAEPRQFEGGLLELVAAVAAQLGSNVKRKKAEEALRKSEQKYRSLVENARDIIFTVAPDATILSLNPAFEEITEWTRKEWVGKKFTPLAHPDDWPVVMEKLRNVSNGETVSGLEARVATKSGGYRCLEVTMTPEAEHGQVVYISGVARDVTERKSAEAEKIQLASEQAARAQAEAEQERATFLAESSALIFSSLDYESTPSTIAHMAVLRISDWCVVYLTGADGSIDRLELAHANPFKDQLVKIFRRTIPRMDQKDHPVIKTLRTGQSVLAADFSPSLLDTIAPEADQRRVIEDLGLKSYMSVPIQSRGRTVGAIWFAMGDSDHRFGPDDLELAEELAIRAGIALDNARLYSESLKAKEALGRARDAALESSKVKSEFVANVSHEIRTPMNAIIGMTGLLLNSKLQPQQKDFAETIRNAGDALLAIINDILDFSKIEAGKMSLETDDFDFRSVVQSTVDVLLPRAEAKKLIFESSIDPAIPIALRGDPGRLRQVLINLLSNAIKFTERGRVTFRAHNEAETASHVIVRLEIIDTGVGIPLERQPQLFHPFSQADNSVTRKYGGSGLGLAISKRFVELMGGVMEFESKASEGSTFWFRVPFAKQTSPTSGASKNGQPKARREFTPAKKAKRKSTHILVAEDNSVNQKVVLLQLKKLGYRADAVASGTEALEALRHIPYNIVLMDCQMPEMDGYTATGQIRKKERGRHIPIIAMTAHAMTGDREKCLQAGMDDYLAKPVRTEDLEAVLRRWEEDAATDTGEPKFTGLKLPSGLEDPALIREITRLFLKKAPAYLAAVHKAFEREDAQTLKVAAHTLKGACANVGVESMADLCLRIEEAAESGPLQGVAGSIAELDGQYRSVRKVLTAKRKKRRNHGTAHR